jgi:signal transduction histidine kinase/ActR/RegA family two-component response regulator
VHLSANASGDVTDALCVVATDLTDRQQMEEIVAEERLASSIFDQVAEAIVVCDQHGLILRASQAAHRLCGDNPLLRSFAATFPLSAPDGVPTPTPDEILARALAGRVVSGLELALSRNGGARRSLLVSAAPLFSAQRRAVGCIITMTDISERKQVEEEKAALLAREQAARADAEAANRTKDEFLATMSHELRTPLNAMLGWAVMLRDKATDPELCRGLAVIERNARSQTRLIEDLLDVSRIISGKLQIRLDPIELQVVAAAAVDVVRPAAEAKGIELHLRAEQEMPAVSGDADRLQQIVWNLVSNAVKFTPRGGSVWVDVSRRDSSVCLRVRDTGRGIGAELLPYVFERFRQADSSSTRTYGGLGLGLAIVRHLVELHGGTVVATSNGQDRGSAFSVHLPVRAIVRQAEPVGVPNVEPESVRYSPGEPDLAGLRVLVVDDDDDARELVSELLRRSGAVVASASSAGEALEELHNDPPDVLVSDIGMPGVDGHGLVRQLRALPPERGGRTPALALTAYAGVEHARRALAAGFQRHLSKPADPAELMRIVANLGGRTSEV